MTSNTQTDRRTDRQTDGHHFLEITRVYGSGKKKYLHPPALRAGGVKLIDVTNNAYLWRTFKYIFSPVCYEIVK